MRAFKTLGAVFALLVAGGTTATASVGTVEVTEDFTCLAAGDIDDQAHYEELKLIAQYHEAAGNVHPNAAVYMLGQRLRAIGLPSGSDHDAYHDSARQRAEILIEAGASDNPNQAREAAEAYMTWRKNADADQLECPKVAEPALAVSSPTGTKASKARPSADASSGGSPTTSAGTVLRHASAHRDDPAALVGYLSRPDSQRVLAQAGRMEDAVHLAVDATIEAEHARLVVLNKTGSSSQADYDAALANLEAASAFAAECGFAAYRAADITAFKAAIYRGKAELPNP